MVYCRFREGGSRRSRPFWNARKSGIKGNVLVVERTKDNKCCYCHLTHPPDSWHSQNPLNSGYIQVDVFQMSSQRQRDGAGGTSKLVKGIGEHILHRRYRTLLQLLNSPTSNTATIKWLQSDRKRPHIYAWEYQRNTWPCSAPVLWLHQLMIPGIPGAIWRSMSAGGFLE